MEKLDITITHDFFSFEWDIFEVLCTSLLWEIDSRESTSWEETVRGHTGRLGV